jgi:ankyrin repeat protein
MTTPQQEMLFKAIEQGNATKVEELFTQTDLDPNFIINGTTPVHLAAQIGNAAILGLLITNGANTLAQNAYGLDPVDATEEYIQDQHLEPIQYEPVFALLLGETAPTTTMFHAAVAASC